VDALFSSYLERGPQVEAVEMFLIGAICNALRSYLRRTNAPEALLGGDEPGAATPGDALLHDFDRRLLGQILACLDKSHLEMLRRYYRKDERVEAIAAAIGGDARDGGDDALRVPDAGTRDVPGDPGEIVMPAGADAAQLPC